MVKTSSLFTVIVVLFPMLLFAQGEMRPFSFTFNSTEVIILISLLALTAILLFAIWLLHRIETIRKVADRRYTAAGKAGYSRYIQQLDSRQLGRLIDMMRNRNKKISLILFFSSLALSAGAQPSGNGDGGSLLGQTGIIITIVLLLITILVGFIIMVGKASLVLQRYQKKMDMA